MSIRHIHHFPARLRDDEQQLKAFWLSEVKQILVFVWQVDAWAQSSIVPGFFTGSTGAQVLSSEDLSTSGPQAWLKKVWVHKHTQRNATQHKTCFLVKKKCFLFFFFPFHTVVFLIRPDRWLFLLFLSCSSFICVRISFCGRLLWAAVSGNSSWGRWAGGRAKVSEGTAKGLWSQSSLTSRLTAKVPNHTVGVWIIATLFTNDTLVSVYIYIYI